MSTISFKSIWSACAIAYSELIVALFSPRSILPICERGKSDSYDSSSWDIPFNVRISRILLPIALTNS